MATAAEASAFAGLLGCYFDSVSQIAHNGSSHLKDPGSLIMSWPPLWLSSFAAIQLITGLIRMTRPTSYLLEFDLNCLQWC